MAGGHPVSFCLQASAAAVIASLSVALLALRKFFTRDHQLILPLTR